MILSFGSLFGIVLLGYKARLFLWLLFGVPWSTFTIHLGTGKNCCWVFCLGIATLLLEVVALNVAKWIRADFTKFRDAGVKQIPGY